MSGHPVDDPGDAGREAAADQRAPRMDQFLHAGHRRGQCPAAPVDRGDGPRPLVAQRMPQLPERDGRAPQPLRAAQRGRS
jgi:hypothetical protein